MVGENGGEGDRLAPVIPLFGARASEAKPSPSSDRRGGKRTSLDEDGTPSDRHPAFAAAAPAAPAAAPAARLRALRSQHSHTGGDAEDGVDPDELLAKASESLVRKLRSRAMSIAEATTFLRGLGVPSASIADIIDEFSNRRYLDDAVLAEQLVTAGHERKGQGRVMLSRVLAQRGIPRDVVDAALEVLPDDDTERALEYARSKMSSLARLDQETAKRRLSGQLARRGYPGGVVSNVIRQVFAEQGQRPFPRGRSSGVRFEESDD